MMISKQPHPERTPCLLLAYNAPKEAAELAESVGCRVLRIPPWERLPDPIRGHPDMLVFPLENKDGTPKLLLAADYYRENVDFWRTSGISVELTDHPFGNVYPADIGLNQLVMNDCLFGRLDVAAPEIRDAYPIGVKIRQGYARCSVMKLGEHAAVTADRALAAALSAHRVDTLLVSQGHIQLEGYDYGFIGGASYPLPDRSVGLFGDLSAHPDGDAIVAFAEQQGVKLYSTAGMLSDFGGGILLR